MDFKPSAVASAMGRSYSPAMSSSTESSSRKRAFSEVEDHNTPKSDMHKLHKHDEVDQENRDPLGYDGQKMDIDDPVPTAIAPLSPSVDVNNSTQTPSAEAEKSTLSSTTGTPSLNTTLTLSSHSVPSTPPLATASSNNLLPPVLLTYLQIKNKFCPLLPKRRKD